MREAVTVGWIEEGCDEIKRALLAGEHDTARRLFYFIASRCRVANVIRARLWRRQGCRITGCECLRRGRSSYCYTHKEAA